VRRDDEHPRYLTELGEHFPEEPFRDFDFQLERECVPPLVVFDVHDAFGFRYARRSSVE
jgi:hypothetical protein